MKYVPVVLLAIVGAVSAQEQIPAPKIKVRTDEGTLVIVKNGSDKRSDWNWYLQAKDYKWLLGMPTNRKTNEPEEGVKGAEKLEGKDVVITSRAGYFGIGNQKSLLVLKIELRAFGGKPK